MKEGKVPLATFPSPELGQSNETTDCRNLEVDRVAAAPAAAVVSVSLERQDLEPLPFPFDDPDSFKMVEVPRPPLLPP